MKTILRVKNFGPITDAELDLRNVNVLIGPQASGKSTLAKLYTICKSPVMYHEITQKSRFAKPNKLFDLSKNAKLSLKKLKESLRFFCIESFLSDDSVIEFDSTTHYLIITKDKIEFIDRLKLDKIIHHFEANDLVRLNVELQKLRKISIYFNFEYVWLLFKKRNANKGKLTAEMFNTFHQSVKKGTDIDLLEAESLAGCAIKFKEHFFLNKAIYIPAERTIVTLLRQASYNFMLANLPIPGHLVDYAAQYEKATFNLKTLNLSFLNKKTEYQNVNGRDLIVFDKNKSIPLTESASGYQSVVPMLLPIKFLRGK